MAAHPVDYRYGSPEMRAVFDEEKRLSYCLEVEAALALSLAELRVIPKEDAARIVSASRKVKLERVREWEEQTRHDVMAIVTALTEASGPAGKYVHLTATSYDIVDSALALQLKEALSITTRKARVLLSTLCSQAEKRAGLVMAGRTHGQQALPITLGFKLANYCEKLGGDIDNLEWDANHLLLGKFSGAVGTYASQKEYGINGTELEKLVMRRLGISPAAISTQVVGREGMARVLCDVAVLAGTLEQMAKEVRNLQRTEIGELSEPFGQGQVGSSAMAQKRNPIDSENICSNARVVRSCVAPALENIALEHERDLTNSAAERSILPTAFILTDDMLDRANKVFSTLVVREENIKRNLDSSLGTMAAEAVMNELVKKGMPRQEAHALLSQKAGEAVASRTHFSAVLAREKAVTKLVPKARLVELCDYSNYSGNASAKALEAVAKWRAFLKKERK